MGDKHETVREDGRDPALEADDVGGNQSSGIARETGQPDEAASGGIVDATLRGDPGTAHAMGLGNEPAPSLDDPEADLDAVERPD